MKVIILSISKYKEKDCIYNAISEEQSLSFKAKGAQDNKSKFVWLNNVLTVADVEFLEGKYKYPVLKDASLESSPLMGNSNLDFLFSASALAGLTLEMFEDADRHLAYNDLIEASKALKKEKDTLIVFLIYLARCMTLAGAQLEVDRCVFSQSTEDIVAFSFADGGFVSRKYVTEETPLDLSTAQMKLIRYCFKAPDYSCLGIEKYTKEDKQIILHKFIDFIDEFLGVKIDQLDFLLNK